jgi:quercetin dioxygenase-like cupin family protein
VVRFHLDHLRDPIGHFDLTAVDRTLRESVACVDEGYSAVTLAKYPDLRVVLISMRAGARIEESKAEARLSLQAVRGHAVLRLPEGPIELSAQQLITLERGMLHGLEAVTDCALLLTLAWPTNGELRPRA